MKERQWNTEQKSYPSQVRLHSLLMPVCFTASGGPVGITSGPDGNLWFTEYVGNKIGQIIIQ
jgi:streptogramin lyase